MHVPAIFDIENPCEKRGENCALIACRRGNYPMIKALHKICGADFFRMNNFDENALLICASACKYYKSRNYLECMYYLIKNVKIDIRYKYEDVLLLVNDAGFLDFFQEELRKIGILVDRKDVINANLVECENNSSVSDSFSEDGESILDKFGGQSVYSNSRVSSILPLSKNSSFISIKSNSRHNA